MNWLQELPLSERAAAFRRTLSPSQFAHLQRSIEHLAMVTHRPLIEVAERLLLSVNDMTDGAGPDAFLSLIGDICEEHEA